MANEITEIGQLAPYGGPQLTLLGSSLAGLVNSILIRQGTGTARTWKVFDPTKADYLNTYKVLSPGDVVLVNAKAVPLSFPVQTAGAGGSSDTGVFIAPAAAQSLFPALVTSRFQFGPALFIAGAGSVDMRLGNGPFQSYDAFNAAAAALSDAQIQAANIPFTVRITQANGAAATVEIPIF